MSKRLTQNEKLIAELEADIKVRQFAIDKLKAQAAQQAKKRAPQVEKTPQVMA